MIWGVLRSEPVVVLWPESLFETPEFISYVVYPSRDKGMDYWSRQSAEGRLVAENVTR